MKQLRKWMGILLSIFMMVSIIPIQAQGAGRNNKKIESMSPALQSLEHQVKDYLKPTDPVKLIVELKNTDKINIATVNKNKAQVIAASKSVIQKFENTISSKKITGKVVNSYSYLFAGVTIDTTLAEARKIASLPEVNMVEIAINFDRPQIEESSPAAKPSAPITPSAILPYKGVGQLIAIVGQGADPGNQDMRLTNNLLAKYPDATVVDAKIAEYALLGLTLPGSFFSDKIPYAYNYKDADANIIELQDPSMGMHIAGLAAGNGDQMTSYFLGVAPEAQLLIMKVYGDVSPTTSTDIYVKAIEDSILLGADSINLALGTPSGSLIDVGAISTAAIQKAFAAGAMVNVSGGNNGYFGYKFDLPDAKSPDYGVISEPAIVPNAFAVASSSAKTTIPNIMSDFSSWGIAPDGDLKPEITAPGSDIYSTLNYNLYGNMSGTEMATAQISGAVALVGERLKAVDLLGRGEQTIRSQSIKNILMNTAKPHIDLTTTPNALTSPRKQGAGIMDLEAALSSDVTITNNQNEAKLVLNDISVDTFTLDTTIHNYGSASVTYNVRTVINTDGVANGKMTLKPRQLKEINGGQITIPANSSMPLSVPVDVSEFRNELIGQMPNGYFLEGFILLEHATLPDLSLPYTAFRGNWNSLPILEDFIYDYDLAVDQPFYYDQNLDDFTHFGTWLDTTYSVIGETTGSVPPRTFDKTLLGLSPNGDYYYDEIEFTGVFLRNFKDVRINIYQPGGTVPIHSSYLDPNVPLLTNAKNYYGGTGPKSHFFSQWNWNGKINGVPVADGDYVIEVAGALNATGAPLQTTRYNMKVDTVGPKLTSIQWDPTTGKLTLEMGDPNGIGVYFTELTESPSTVIGKNPGGYYQLPANANLANYTIYSEDHLGNFTESLVSDLLSTVVPTVTRIQGVDRYETAALISSGMMVQSNTVVLASGQNYPDALSGIAYAAELNAPMLLTRNDILPQFTLTEIQRLQATTVVILGGTSAISQAVEDELKTYVTTVTRIQGLDRYETAANIGQEMVRTNKKVFLASGMNFADAISIGAASALSGNPVLLTQSLNLPLSTNQALIDWGIQSITILGGTTAISQDIEDNLRNRGFIVDRIAGLDRFETNYSINKAYFTDPLKVYVASGMDYPDALTGALLAAHNNTTIVLTKKDLTPPSLTTYFNEKPSINEVVILGGPSAVSETVKNNILQLLLN